MGGGGSDNYDTRIIDRLAKVASDSFKDAQPEKRNVFISFDNRDLGAVNLLRGQAKNENSDLEFNDYSLREPFNSERAEYIKSGIRERIRQASVTVVYISDVTHESDWVDWEVRESREQGKGVVCVHSGDTPPSKLPGFVKEFNLKVVPWKHDQLSAAIEEAAQKRG
ncbi:MAG: TIR domain-containing protein [Bacteroidia bacterium]|nr:TIR domain-containing protein [Bacteroidia bacterium]